MESFRKFLAGYKTYITAAVGLLTALLGFAVGELDLIGLIAGIIGSTGLATLRAGVKTEVEKVVTKE